MTIQEAIKSGKKFKRPLHTLFHDARTGGAFTGVFLYNDVLATDWEIEIVKKELSADDVRRALRDPETVYGEPLYTIEGFIKKLGLE